MATAVSAPRGLASRYPSSQITRRMRREASIHHNHVSGLFFFTTSAPTCLDGASLGGDDNDTAGGGRGR